MTELYRTPLGVMEQEVELPEEYQQLKARGIKCIQWHGHKILVGAEFGTDFFMDIESRRNKNESIILVLSGSPGKGKSYFALKLAELFDNKFKIIDIPPPAPAPDQDPSQVVFEREHFLYLSGNQTPLKRGQVIVLDEAQIQAGSRSWYDREQQSLVHQIESIRYRGFIIIIVVLHLEMLDKIIRKFVLSHKVHIEDRGVGTVYTLYTPRFATDMHKRKVGKLYLPLPDSRGCSNKIGCLECLYLHDPEKRCVNLKAVYERRKLEFLTRLSNEAQQRSKEEKNKFKKMSIPEALKYILANRELLTYNRKNNFDRTRMKALLVKNGLTGSLSRDTLADIANALELEFDTRGIPRGEKK